MFISFVLFMQSYIQYPLITDTVLIYCALFFLFFFFGIMHESAALPFPRVRNKMVLLQLGLCVDNDSLELSKISIAFTVK